MNVAAIEIAILEPGDPDYSETVFEYRDQLTVYLLEIKNLFNTEPGTVIGAMDKGIDLESLVFEMNLVEDDINQRIISQIQKYATMASYFSTKVQTKFAKGTVRDVVFCDITIDGTKYLQIRLK